MTEWELHGMEFGNCNCAYACPCQFNALPTHGNCQAIGFFSVEKGHFGDTKLDGLNMAFAVSWPGAVHHGRGTMQPVIDKRANEAQRNALLSIMTGKETDPMTTFWAVYTAMCETIKEPIYTTISIDIDMHARRATCKAEVPWPAAVNRYSTPSPGQSIVSVSCSKWLRGRAERGRARVDDVKAGRRTGAGGQLRPLVGASFQSTRTDPLGSRPGRLCRLAIGSTGEKRRRQPTQEWGRTSLEKGGKLMRSDRQDLLDGAFGEHILDVHPSTGPSRNPRPNSLRQSFKLRLDKVQDLRAPPTVVASVSSPMAAGRTGNDPLAEAAPDAERVADQRLA